jgi:ATP adenylyltransferase
MTGDSGIRPGQRLWTPWRMAYVASTGSKPGCIFCDAVAGSNDVESLVVHRGRHAFVMLNLFPYNTGHLMVVPDDHVSDPGALTPEARAEIAELTASFCTGLRATMRCDGMNTGMNLGSAAGAGIADHLHQHIVPRWVGDANFMPIIGGTKVLPELIPATYAKIRAEVARQRSGATAVTIVLLDESQTRLYLDRDALPEIPIPDGATAWDTARATLAPHAETCALLGWAGPASTRADGDGNPALMVAIDPRGDLSLPWKPVPASEFAARLPGAQADVVAVALQRISGSGI